jgi:phage tail sheath protein FI
MEYRANAVVAKLKVIRERLGAVLVVDGPNQTKDPIPMATKYRDLNGGEGVYIVDPYVAVDRDGEPASARASGIFSKIAFWESPSNRVINGIIGTARAISFALDDHLSEANLLNAKGVATIIRQDGFRLWGPRSSEAFTSKTSFINVYRIRQQIRDVIIKNHLWAMAQGISGTYFESVKSGVNAYLSSLEALGAIMGGECMVDPDDNTPQNLEKGYAVFQYEFTPTYPAERLIFKEKMSGRFAKL